MAAPARTSTMYGFVRARQLEGTFPGDPQTGVWLITNNRVLRGWGAVPERDWPRISSSEPWPPTEPPGLDAKAKPFRILYYQRIVNSLECKLAIASGRPVVAAFEVSEQWLHAENGVIDVPPRGTSVIGSHAVNVVGYSDEEERFKFVNSWGQDWGDRGFGYLPYELFDRSLLEAWITESRLTPPPLEATSGIVEIRWGVPDHLGRILHVREFYDADSDERLGWAFAIQQDDFLDVEELYVRPQYRLQGHGTRLLQLLTQLSAEAVLPLRFFIPFADCGSANLAVARHLLSKAGHVLTPTGVRWSPLMAVLDVGDQVPSFPMPAPPALCAATWKQSVGIPVNGAAGPSQTAHAEPVSESSQLLKQPDWASQSDEAFLTAAKAAFQRNASLLRRLA